MPDGHIAEPLIGGFLCFVAVRPVIQHLLHLPQMLLRRHHVEKVSAGLQHPPELVNGQRGKAVQQQTNALVCHRQAVSTGHYQLRLLGPFGGPPHHLLGDVDARRPGRFPSGGQCLADGGGIVPLSAAHVQHGRYVGRIGHSQGAQGLPQKIVISFGKKGAAGSCHGFVVAGGFGMPLVYRQQIGIALLGDVVAMAAGAVIRPFPSHKRPAADRTAEQAHGSSPSGIVTSWIHTGVRHRSIHRGTFSRHSP